MGNRLDVIDERIKASKLYDYYGSLLNENQKELCNHYLFDDLSLSEISENAGISRQGVHDKVKRSIKQMETYEERLSLIAKTEKIEELLEEIRIKLEKEKSSPFVKFLDEKLRELDCLL